MSYFIFHFFNFIKFVLAPKNVHIKVVTRFQKIAATIIVYLPMCVIIAVLFWNLAVWGVKIGLYDELIEKYTDISISHTLFSGVLVAPLAEELIFRFPLRFFMADKQFRWYYYIFSLIFGLIHLSNYQLEATHYYYSILIVSAQIYTGLVFGYIRIIYGFWFGVLLHSLHNFVCILYYYLV